jgi:hypothetical protein
MINDLPHYERIFPPCLIGGARDELFACVGGPVGALMLLLIFDRRIQSGRRGRRIKLGPLSAQGCKHIYTYMEAGHIFSSTVCAVCYFRTRRQF